MSDWIIYALLLFYVGIVAAAASVLYRGDFAANCSLGNVHEKRVKS